MEEADYVIIGAGSAGCALAARLSADGRSTVALVEAGGSDRSLWVRMPIGYGGAFHHPRLNWRLTTDPQPGLDNRAGYWPRGRVLGGSSSINGMIFIRGAREDFDDWAARGNPGWEFDALLPIFKRIEDFSGGADNWRGAGGPISVSDISRSAHPLSAAFIDAAVAAGLPRNRDFNGAAQEGVGFYQLTTKRGLRSSAATGYLAPARRRGNLAVLTEALAEALVIEHGRAVGLRYRRGGESRVLRARREVLVSAGAVGSPCLLQRSGIGDANYLRGLGVAVQLDRPAVGGNLQDHVGFDFVYAATRPTLNNVLRPLWPRMMAGARYLTRRDGPLSLGVNQAGGFARSGPDHARPNLQLYFSPLSYTRAVPGKRRLTRPDVFAGFMTGISNCRPKSRGWLRIRDADPATPPQIQPNALDHPDDMAEMLEGAWLLRRIAEQSPLADVIAREIAPGPDARSEEEMARYIRQSSGTVFHPCGGCAMGPDPAAGAVVDARLRVHGLRGLRVIDASIFPNVLTGNTNAAALMVGEKGAEMVLEDRDAASR